MLDSMSMPDGLELVVRDAEGRVKTTRYVKPHSWGYTEFLSNKFYIKLINKGFIEPNTKKVPFLFGNYKIRIKE